MQFQKFLALLVIFLAVFAIPHVGFLAAEVLKVAFVSSPQSIVIETPSEQITIQTQDSAGNESKVPSTACAALSSSSSGGEFSSSATDWSLVSVLTIAKNSANRNFYYKDKAAGTHTLTVRVVLRPEGESRSCASWPKEEWPPGWEAEQSIIVGASGASHGADSSSSTPQSTTSSQTSSPQGGSSSSVTKEYKPQIYVSAFVPQRSIAGAPVLLDAEAIGLKREPLPNARYVWSFGDGGSAEGKKLYHTYHYPAPYTVLVSASSGEWSAVDRKEIVIDAPELIIANLQEGADGFIEVRNNGAHDVDLSFWILKGASGTFIIPNGTIVGAKKAIPFPAQITGLLAAKESAALLYPNGSVAVLYSGKSKTSSEVSVQAPASAAIPAVFKEAKPTLPITSSPAAPLRAEAHTVTTPSPAALSNASSAPAIELIGAASASGSRGMLPWLGGVVLFLLAAVGGYFALLQPPRETDAAEKLKEEAAEYDITEEVSSR